jgi:hypothetical protein
MLMRMLRMTMREDDDDDDENLCERDATVRIRRQCASYGRERSCAG